MGEAGHVRVLIGECGLDGHDRGVKVAARKKGYRTPLGA